MAVYEWKKARERLPAVKKKKCPFERRDHPSFEAWHPDACGLPRWSARFAVVGHLATNGRSGRYIVGPRVPRVIIDQRLSHTSVRVILDAIVLALLAGWTGVMGVAQLTRGVQA